MEDYFYVYPMLPKDSGDIHGMFMIRVEIAGLLPNQKTILTFGVPKFDKSPRQVFTLDIYAIINIGLSISAHDQEMRLRRLTRVLLSHSREV